MVLGASPVVLVVKNAPANTGDTVWSLGREDPLEEEMATHSSILPWEIQLTEEPGDGDTKGWTWLRTHTHGDLSYYFKYHSPSAKDRIKVCVGGRRALMEDYQEKQGKQG